MADLISVRINGRTLTLVECAERFGLGIDCLRARYHKGDRGDRLVRPLDKTGSTRSRNPDLDAIRENTNVKRQRERMAYEAKQRKLLRREAAQEEMRKLHAQAFSRPLISKDILTPAERQREHERVKNSGQRSWSTTGASL